MESKQGKVDLARQLFETGSKADPHHLHIWQAWGVLEYREGNLDRAREMFQQAVWAQPKGKDVATVWQASPGNPIPRSNTASNGIVLLLNCFWYTSWRCGLRG